MNNKQILSGHKKIKNYELIRKFFYRTGVKIDRHTNERFLQLKVYPNTYE